MMSFAGDSTLVDCLKQLDHMLGMEDVDSDGETACQGDGDGDTDHQLSSFDST